MKNQQLIMREAGYVTAMEAANAIGVGSIQTIHRMVQTGVLAGARAASHWYVSVASLLERHADAPPLLARIRALGVDPVAAPLPAPATKKTTPKKKRKAA